MGYVALPVAERSYGNITAIAGVGNVIENTFVSYDASTGVATTAATGALNLMIATETATAGDQVNCKFLGLAYLSVNAAAAITVGAMLLPTTAGVGIVTVTDKHKASAIAMDVLASSTGTILVKLACFTVSI
jgi:hypothetical protein